jgi:hypothetical protein
MGFELPWRRNEPGWKKRARESGKERKRKEKERRKARNRTSKSGRSGLSEFGNQRRRLLKMLAIGAPTALFSLSASAAGIVDQVWFGGGNLFPANIDGKFIGLDELPRVEDRELTSEEFKLLLRLMDTDPERLFLSVVNGKPLAELDSTVPLSALSALHTWPLARPVRDENRVVVVTQDNSPVTEVVPISSLPKRYLNDNQDILAVYRPQFYRPVAQDELPEDFLSFLQASEGTPKDNDMHAVQLALRAWKNNSGRSTIPDQVIDMFVGLSGTSPIDYRFSGSLDTADHSLRELVTAFNRGDQVPDGLDSLLGNEDLESDDARQKLLALLLGEGLWHIHGEEGQEGQNVTMFYLNNLAMGTFKESHIIGLAPFCDLVFRKQLKQLNRGEQIILLAMIPDAAGIIRVLEKGTHEEISNIFLDYDRGIKTAAKGKLENFLEKGVVTESDYDVIQNEINNFVPPSEKLQTHPDYLDYLFEDLTDRQEKAIKVINHLTFSEMEAKLGPEAFDVSTGEIKISLTEEIIEKILGPEVIPFDPEQLPAQEELEAFVWCELLNGKYVPPEVNQYLTALGLPRVSLPVSHDWSNTSDSSRSIQGFSATVVDGNTNQVIAQHDPSSAGDFVGKINVLETGSTIKPFIIAFLLSIGHLTSLDEKRSDTPGNVRMADINEPLLNATNDPLGDITIREAIANSRNKIIQELLSEYIWQGVGRDYPVSWENRKSIRQRWEVFQDYMRKHGFEFTDIRGKPIVDPIGPTEEDAINGYTDEIMMDSSHLEHTTDQAEARNIAGTFFANKGVVSDTPAIGTGEGASLRNVRGPNLMAAYTQAFGSFSGHNDDFLSHHDFTDDEIDDIRSVGEVIEGKSYLENSIIWTPDNLRMLNLKASGVVEVRCKTGSVEKNESRDLSAVLACYYIKFTDGSSRAVTVNLRSYSQTGNTQVIGDSNYGSTVDALPFALAVAMKSREWPVEIVAESDLFNDGSLVARRDNQVFLDDRDGELWKDRGLLNTAVAEIDMFIKAYQIVKNKYIARGNSVQDLTISLANLRMARVQLESAIARLDSPEEVTA